MQFVCEFPPLVGFDLVTWMVAESWEENFVSKWGFADVVELLTYTPQHGAL